MAPVPGRPAARGTWHVPPREGLQKVVDAPTGQTGGANVFKLTGHTYTTPTCVLFGCRSCVVQAARARGGKLF